MPPYLSIVIPVYNEEDILESSLNKNIGLLERSGYTYEIIVVNDGSSDSSAQILDNFFSGLKNIEIIHLAENRGFGGAMKTGIQATCGEYVWSVPVDSPLTDKTFNAFKSHLGEADILVGYRVERKGYNWWMNMNSRVFHFIVSSLFGLKLKDYNWIHLYRNKIFKEGSIKIEYDGLFMLAEVLIKATRKQYSIIEFPIDQEQRLTGIASASKLKNVFKTFLDILKFRLSIWLNMS